MAVHVTTTDPSQVMAELIDRRTTLHLDVLAETEKRGVDTSECTVSIFEAVYSRFQRIESAAKEEVRGQGIICCNRERGR